MTLDPQQQSRFLIGVNHFVAFWECFSPFHGTLLLSLKCVWHSKKKLGGIYPPNK